MKNFSAQSDEPDSTATGGSQWAAPAHLGTIKDILPQIGDITPFPRHDCVFMGLSGAGKSSFLSALGRPDRRGLPRGFVISLSPGEALAKLAGDAAGFMAAGTGVLPATENPADYDLQVELKNGHDETHHVQMAVRELPGREIFGDPECTAPFQRSAHAQFWLQEAKKARCLILCIDSVNPDRLRWEILLPQLLGSLAVDGNILVHQFSQPDRRPALSPKRQLPYARILILLTKIDKLYAAVASADLDKAPPLLASLARRPRELTAQLDPVLLVQDLLGTPFLDQLNAAAPEAQVAVGLSSAWGFSTRQASSSPVRTRDLQMNEPQSPFGVLESVLFIASGEALPPVARLPPTVSAHESQREILLRFGGYR